MVIRGVSETTVIPNSSLSSRPYHPETPTSPLGVVFDISGKLKYRLERFLRHQRLLEVWVELSQTRLLKRVLLNEYKIT